MDPNGDYIARCPTVLHQHLPSPNTSGPSGSLLEMFAKSSRAFPMIFSAVSVRANGDCVRSSPRRNRAISACSTVGPSDRLATLVALRGPEPAPAAVGAAPRIRHSTIEGPAA